MERKYTKKQNQRFHARIRAEERYGITYNKYVRAQILKLIADGKTIIIKKQSNRLSIREVTLEEKQIVFVYDKERKEVVTFLPPEEVTFEKL